MLLLIIIGRRRCMACNTAGVRNTGWNHLRGGHEIIPRNGRSNRLGHPCTSNKGSRMKNSVPKPPPTLSTEARAMWRAVQTEYQIIDRGGIVILGAACESFDRMREAQRLVDTEGMTTLDRFKQKKPHPAVIIERDAR